MPERSASPDWPAAIEVVNDAGTSDVVLICEHASNHIPAEFGRLGLADADLTRHIAWDIGAEQVVRRLAAKLDAACFIGTYSRLLIDLNRPLDSPTSMPQRSESTDIPGNRSISDTDRQRRIDHIFTPFHARVSQHLDARDRQRQKTLIVAIHSFTPVFLGQARPWHAGILYDRSAEFAQSVIAWLADDEQLVIGANVPYVIDRMADYAIPVHGEDRGYPSILIEIRNDLIAGPVGAEQWAERLAGCLQARNSA